MALEIKRAAELVDAELEARWARRREASHAEVLQHVLRAFVERPGPVEVEDIVNAFPDRAPEGIRLAWSRKPRESWSGWVGEARASAESRPHSERRSTSSGRKSTWAHGERRIPTSPAPALRCLRRSGSVSGSLGGS